MRTLHFKGYKFENGTVRPAIEYWDGGFRSIPVDVAREELTKELAELGFDIANPGNLRVGFLAKGWGEHPRMAMVVARSTNMLNGQEIAVSNEPAPPPPAGMFYDDPALQEICEEAYRQRDLGSVE